MKYKKNCCTYKNEKLTLGNNLMKFAKDLNLLYMQAKNSKSDVGCEKESSDAIPVVVF